ncbi:MAG: YbjQ family protein [Halobacteriales archaeon]|nr:YbjQ family protein [Halobacteriales archaeon]
MIVTNTDSVPDRDVVEILGLVKGNTVRARNVGRDITQSIRNIAGGELKSYSGLMSDSRDEALERMEAHARDLDADAVLNVRFETSEIAQGSAEVLAYGTAVRLR